jgi:hypothetical protein
LAESERRSALVLRDVRHAPTADLSAEPQARLTEVPEPSFDTIETGAAEGGGPSNENTNVWPDEAAESAFLSEIRGANMTSSAAPIAGKTAEPANESPLPPLDILVQRIPAETRELLDELFRAKFTTVRRIQPADLKS